MSDQTAKHDAGKPRPTLVPTQIIYDIAKIREYDQATLDGIRPQFLYKTRKQKGVWKGMFVCPFCGKEFEAYICNVMSGRQKSCGCAKGALSVRSKGTHGDTQTRLYTIWRHIQERCNSPSCKEYKWYGQRGIKCLFENYEQFRDYAYQNGYSDNLTCERIDVNGNYEPGNITFIPTQMQAWNTTKSVRISYKGLTLCAAEWASILGIKQNVLTKRKRTGWSDKKAIETPVNGSVNIEHVPIEIIRAIRETRLYGIRKYPDGGVDNWKTVEIERYRDAAFRHFLAYLDDPHGVDRESGLPHLWHLVTNLAFICEMEKEALNDPNN